MKKIILILIVIAAVTSGCDKYEQTIKKIYGEYTLKTYTVNNADSLSLYKDSLGIDFYFFNDDLHGQEMCYITGARNDGKEKKLYWIWDLRNNNNNIEILDSYGPIGTGPFGNNKCPSWKIIYLKNEQIKISTNFNNKKYFIELE